MADHDREQDRERWTKLVADYEASDLTQREFGSERGVSSSNLRNLRRNVEDLRSRMGS